MVGQAPDGPAADDRGLICNIPKLKIKMAQRPSTRCLDHSNDGALSSNKLILLPYFGKNGAQPGEVGWIAANHGERQDAGCVIGMEAPHRRRCRIDQMVLSFDQQDSLLRLFELPFPPINRGHRRQDVDARGQTLFNQPPPDA